MKETGKFGEDVIKTLRLALFPLQYLATYQDRLARHLRRSIDRVPEERRTVPIEALALPIVEQLKFHDEKSVVGQMFVNLLARAMDRERVGEAHPAFVQIVGQLAPDEAVLIRQIAHAKPSAYLSPLKRGQVVLLKSARTALIDASSMPQGHKQLLESISVCPE
ncbi:Abi-alpha family protein [Burkholderia ambifaria]|uniref:Abi-alpha family protein n=1 Tax=Burkholderia ambifaria TaxID=152480 RepID=UPI00158CEFAD|nr:Abi-alpha family protein [Burkholderia ambifaria]